MAVVVRAVGSLGKAEGNAKGNLRNMIRYFGGGIHIYVLLGIELYASLFVRKLTAIVLLSIHQHQGVFVLGCKLFLITTMFESRHLI